MAKNQPQDLAEAHSRFRELAFARIQGKRQSDHDWLLYRFVQAHPVEAVDLLNQLDEEERQRGQREQHR